MENLITWRLFLDSIKKEFGKLFSYKIIILEREIPAFEIKKGGLIIEIYDPNYYLKKNKKIKIAIWTFPEAIPIKKQLKEKEIKTFLSEIYQDKEGENIKNIIEKWCYTKPPIK